MKELTKLITQRKAIRDSLERNSEELEQYVTAKNVEEIEILHELIVSREQAITVLDLQISNALDMDSFEKDQIEVLQFQEKITRMRKKAAKFVEKVPDVPSTPVAPIAPSKEPCRARLPELKVPSFDGKYDEYHSFLDQFKSAIGNRTDVSEIDKLSYLLLYLKGDAARAVRGLTLVAENYKEAMNILDERYGNKDILINTIMSKLVKIKTVSDEWQISALRGLCDELDIGVRQLTSAGITMETYSPILLPMMLGKLPTRILLMWNRKRHGLDNNLKEFLEFLKTEVSDIEYTFQLKKDFMGSTSKPNPKSNGKHNNQGRTEDEKDFMSVFYAESTERSNKDEGKDKKCIFCAGAHESYKCDKAEKMSLKDREQAVRDSKSCWRCLRGGHKIAECSTKCFCGNCGKRHNTFVCKKPKKPKDPKDPSSEDKTKVKTYHLNTDPIGGSILMTLQAQAIDQNGESLNVRIFLDPGSDKSFVCKAVDTKLDLESIGAKNVTIEGFNGTVVSDGELEVKRLELRSIKESRDSVNIPITAMVVPYICHPLKKIPKGPWIQELDCKGIQVGDALQTYSGETAPIDLLIGGDYYPRIIKDYNIRLQSGPMAISSHLGWTLLGPIIKENNNNAVSLLVKSEVTEDEDLHECVSRFWSMEEMGVNKEEAYDHSANSEVMEDFEQGIRQLEDGHYEVSLPKNKKGLMVKNNKWLAQRRLDNLMKKLKQDPDVLQRYHGEMQALLEENIASPAIETNQETSSFYIPHRAVIREDKETSKLRIVFDGSAKDPKGLALNSCLDQGLNLNPELLQLLLRFRLHKVVLVGDLKKAFLQIWIKPEDRELCKFLWFKDPCTDIVPTTYQMNRVLFGLNCSPFLLSATLRHHCTKYLTQYPSTAESLLRDMYVDDWITGGEDENEVLTKYKEGQLIMKEGGFTLTKWKSNSKRVCINIIQDSQAPTVDCSKESPLVLDYTKILGVSWSATDDLMVFDLSSLVEKMESLPIITKRHVLSVGSQIFDPLGLISPYTVRFKRFMQTIWKKELKWDEPLPQYMQDYWSRCIEDLKAQTIFTIPRHVMVQKNVGLQIHVFTDASSSVYAATVFIRVQEDSNVSCRLLMTKARVAPIKQVTIPRLELIGAVLGARLSKYVKDAYPGLANVRSYFWTDSRVVMYWINQPSKTWKTYVQNRVAEIQTTTESATWGWCPGKENPADIPSRGASLQELQDSTLYQNGPEWLLQDESHWPSQDIEATDEAEEERKREKEPPSIVMCSILSENQEKRISTFYKAIRVVGWLYRWVHIIRNKRLEDSEREKLATGVLSVQETSKAELYWWKKVQQDQFANEIANPENLKSRKSSLKQLDPVMGDDGLIRIKGRLAKSDLSYGQKHPIIVKGSHWIVEAYIRKCHELTCHSGVSDTLVLLRKKLWIIRGRNEIKKVIRKCVVCQKQKKETVKQIMAPLPLDRVKEADIFDVVGMDFFGPYYVKPGKDNKAYGLIMTCAVTRAVHLELLRSMETDEFLMAFERFVARRGTPKIIYSDNAKTFKKACRELTPDPEDIIQSTEIRDRLTNKGIEWKYIVERAPWWGGMWERLIRSVKTLMKRKLGRAFLHFDELSTALVQVEGIINSRPLSFVYSEPGEPEPISPNDILIGKKNTVLSPVCEIAEPVDDSEEGIRRRIKHKNALVTQFFKRWRDEYLLELRKTYDHLKRVNEEAALKVGDICLIGDDFVPRQAWKLGRIVQTHKGGDGVTRAVTLKTSKGELNRPVQRLVKLELQLAEALPELDNVVDTTQEILSQTEVEKAGEDVASASANNTGSAIAENSTANNTDSAIAQGSNANGNQNLNTETKLHLRTRVGRKIKTPKYLEDYDLD